MVQSSVVPIRVALDRRIPWAILVVLASAGCSDSAPRNVPFAGFGWVPCATGGEACVFVDPESDPVRVLYGKTPDDGDYNTEIQVASATSVPCTNETFGGNPNPVPWEENFCWFWGRLDPSDPVAEQTNPRIDLPIVSPRFPGYSGPRVQDGPGPGEADGPTATDVSAFRELCGFSHFAFDDPIVYQGQPGRAHLHMFFGNTAIDASSTSASAQANGTSTCAGGTLNRSAYWTPAMIDARTHAPIRPISINAYYKSGYQGVAPGSIAPVPVGLVMISGDAGNTTPHGNRVRFMCDDASGAEAIPWQGTIPDCPSSGLLIMEMVFPQCWDGVNLDSANHKSHMAFGGGSGCPASHPVAIPEISYNIRFRVPNSGGTANWQLSSDGYDVEALGAGLSGHADYMYGWDPATVETFTQFCLNAGMDCHNYLLGDGTMLY